MKRKFKSSQNTDGELQKKDIRKIERKSNSNKLLESEDNPSFIQSKDTDNMDSKCMENNENNEKHTNPEIVEIKKQHFKCLICNVNFNSRSEYRHHIKSHRNDARHNCIVCNKSFENVEKLFSHIRRAHSGEELRLFQCNLCQETFKKITALELHIRQHLENDDEVAGDEENIQLSSVSSLNDYHCLLCTDKSVKQQFLTIEQLIKHMRNEHSLEQLKFSCKYCNEQFIDEQLFIEHDKQYKKRKFYDCHQCGMVFKSLIHLSIHRRTHNTSGRPYACNSCDSKFTRSEDLHTHLRVHKGLPVYQCKFCDRMFVHSKNLSAHLKRIHKNHFKPDDLLLIDYIVEDQNCKRLIINDDENENLYKIDLINDHCKSGGGAVDDAETVVNNNMKAVEQFSLDMLVNNDKENEISNIISENSNEKLTRKLMESIVTTESVVESIPEERQLTELQKQSLDLLKKYNLIRKYKCHLCNLVFVKMKTLEIHCKRNHYGKYSADELKEIEERINRELVEEQQQEKETTNENQTRVTVDVNESTEDIALSISTEINDLKPLQISSALDSVVEDTPSEKIKNNNHECPCCGQNFIDKTEMIKHLKELHDGEKPFKCSKCEMTFARSQTLVEHVQVHVEKRFTCKYCNVTFLQITSLQKHVKRHEGTGLNYCTICNIPYRDLKDLTRHMRTHAQGKPHKCTFCDKSFAQSCDKAKHMRIHTGERPYSCKLCDKTFSHLTSIKKHQFVHSGERPFQCTVCGKSFQHNSNLVVHTRTHTGERPYKCKICEKTFYAAGHYADHMKIHIGDKRFKCDICDKGFVHQSSFQKHKKVHTGEKPYECKMCQRKFSQPGHFKEHLRIHTGEKPYKCLICSKAFRRSDALGTHLRVHHKISNRLAIDNTISGNDNNRNKVEDMPSNKAISKSNIIIRNIESITTMTENMSNIITVTPVNVTATSTSNSNLNTTSIVFNDFSPKQQIQNKVILETQPLTGIPNNMIASNNNSNDHNNSNDIQMQNIMSNNILQIDQIDNTDSPFVIHLQQRCDQEEQQESYQEKLDNEQNLQDQLEAMDLLPLSSETTNHTPLPGIHHDNFNNFTYSFNY